MDVARWLRPYNRVAGCLHGRSGVFMLQLNYLLLVIILYCGSV